MYSPNIYKICFQVIKYVQNIFAKYLQHIFAKYLHFVFCYACHFWILYGIPEAREVSRKLPGAHGFVVMEYESVATLGDPIRAWNYRFHALPDPKVICLETGI